MCSQALTCPDNSHYNICTDTMILLNQIFWGFLVAAESQTCVLSHNRSGWWPEAVKLQKDRESSLYDFCIIFQVFQIHTIALCKDPDPYSLNCAWTVWSPFTSNACKKKQLGHAVNLSFCVLWINKWTRVLKETRMSKLWQNYLLKISISTLYTLRMWSLKVCIFVYLSPWCNHIILFWYRSCIWLSHVSLTSSWLTKDCWRPEGKGVSARITLTPRPPPVPFLTDFSAEVSKRTTGSACIHTAVEKLKNQLW